MRGEGRRGRHKGGEDEDKPWKPNSTKTFYTAFCNKESNMFDKFGIALMTISQPEPE